MTLVEARGIANRFELKEPFSNWDVMVTLEEADETWPSKGCIIYVNFCNPDRDGKGVGCFDYSAYHAFSTESALKSDIMLAIKGMVVHEFREALHFDKVRILDPHKEE